MIRRGFIDFRKTDNRDGGRVILFTSKTRRGRSKAPVIGGLVELIEDRGVHLN